MSSRKYKILLTCEHASNAVPPKYRDRFSLWSLATHRGYDLGALKLAKFLKQKLKVDLIHGEVSRLLVDLNRSDKNPECVNCAKVSADECERILKKYYKPYRDKVLRSLLKLKSRDVPILHISVHSFTRCLRGDRRTTEVGILFDPARRGETAFAQELKKHLSSQRVRTKFNYPYKGTLDGFTVALRKIFKDKNYLGIELEVCSDQLRGSKFQRTSRLIIAALNEAISHGDIR